MRVLLLAVGALADCWVLNASNCASTPVSFNITPGDCLEFQDLPEEEATLDVSATTSTYGWLPWCHGGSADVTICAYYREESKHFIPFKCLGGKSFHNPDVRGWDKPKGMQILRFEATSGGEAHCSASVQNLHYCSKPKTGALIV
jgi:hypothetical protein